VHNDLPVREDVAAVGNREGELDVLLDQQHSTAAIRRVIAHHRQQAPHYQRREAQVELVQQEHLRMPGKSTPDGEHLLLASGEQSTAPVAQLRECRDAHAGTPRADGRRADRTWVRGC
jgi:hypothetical protein